MLIIMIMTIILILIKQTIWSNNKSVLEINSVPSTVLGARHTTNNKTDKLFALAELIGYGDREITRVPME